MPFHVSPKVLDRLEWPRILTRLRERARTPRGRSRCAPSEAGADPPSTLFQNDLANVLECLAETSEARGLLDAGELPPLSGVRDVAGPLERASKGGVLAPRELLDLLSTVEALAASGRFLRSRRVEAPLLAELAGGIHSHQELAAEIEAAIDPEGSVRDDASAVLAKARSDTRKLASELERRLAQTVRDPALEGCLSDRFVTIRNDRYVLPVRADARGRLRGIVHDVSASGATLFIEPEAVVELNNRLKQAELQVEREIVRILRALSAEAAQALPTLEESLALLEIVDLAFARGHVSEEMDALEPEVRDEGVIDLPQLRHPLIDPEEVVANDLRLGAEYTVLVISGPNAGGKTVAMKALALAVLLVRAGLHIPAAAGARIDLFERLLADIGDEQDLARNLSTFSAHMANHARILEAASPRSLVVLDEVGTGTDPSEGAALAQALLETLADSGARVVATTHYNLLKEMADVDPRFANASVEFDAETLAPTFRLHLGVPGNSSAMAVASRMGIHPQIVERARGLLEGGDRRLERMLSELGGLRSRLEGERRAVAQDRIETEQRRQEYEKKLGGLRVRRDQVLGSMGRDLEETFKQAKADVAAVIRDLQRGRTGQDASHAGKRLAGLEEKTREDRKRASEALAPEVETRPMDWSEARVGDLILVKPGRMGVLLELPDRRGRVSVRVGSAKLVLPAAGLGRPDAGETGARRTTAQASVEVKLQRRESDPASFRCDLRGQRVDEALERLGVHLDRAASSGIQQIQAIHGVGTGALRQAVREYLSTSPYVERIRDADPSEGGDGVTIIELH